MVPEEDAMAWVVLLLAGVLEVGWAVGLKFIDGFSRPLLLSATALSMLASLVLLAVALRSLPLGTAYAVWTGIGTIGTAVVGMLSLGESMTPARIACIALIAAGIAGLKLWP
jgi:quaternary ammonium compound-resistance protein SugE